MSQQLKPLVQPATAADVPADWIANLREILLRDGQACRGGASNTIEIQNINQPDIWQPVNLPTNTTRFATAADRDAVLEQFWRAPQ